MVFLFLTSVYLPGLGIPVYELVIGFALLILFCANKNNINIILNFRKYYFFKILVLYTFWIILTGLILSLMGIFEINSYLYSVFLLFIYNNLAWYIYPAIVFPKLFSFKLLIRILLVAIYLICIYGLIEYVCQNIFHSNILTPLQHIILNRRFLINENYDFVTTRLYSVFEEPGYLGGFICINLPVIFNIIFSKYKILKNNLMNLILKKTYIPILGLTIVAMQSPIWLIFSLLVTIIYLRKIIIKNLLVILILACITTSGFIVYYNLTKDFSKNFLSRIVAVYDARDFSQLVKNEPSLATRLICYIARFDIFLKNPITGVGYKNIDTKTYYKTFYSIRLPMTKELTKVLSNKTYHNVGGGIFWNILSDTGIIGAILFYLFVILSVKKINKICSLIPNCLEKNFIIGVKNSYILIICFSIYDIRPNFIYFWFLFGLTLSFVRYYNLNYRNRRYMVEERT